MNSSAESGGVPCEIPYETRLAAHEKPFRGFQYRKKRYWMRSLLRDKARFAWDAIRDFQYRFTVVLDAKSLTRRISPRMGSHLEVSSTAKSGTGCENAVHFAMQNERIYWMMLSPVISSGFARPMISSIVGARSDNLPPSRRETSPHPVIQRGTGFVLWAVMTLPW